MNIHQNSSVAYYSLDALEQISVLAASTQLDWKHIFVRHVRLAAFKAHFCGVPSVMIGMVLKGRLEGNWSLEDGAMRVLDLRPGCIYFLPSLTEVEFQCFSQAEVLSIYIDETFFGNVERHFREEDGHCHRVEVLVDIHDYLMEQLMHSMKELVERGGRFSEIEAAYCAKALAMRIVARHSNRVAHETPVNTGLHPSALRKTIEWIDQNLDQRISVERLARTAGVGPAHFARLFKRATNTTLQQFIIHRRIDRASRLLATTEKPILEIALECGFADQIHLTRFFGRIVGTTPAQYRKTHRMNAQLSE